MSCPGLPVTQSPIVIDCICIEATRVDAILPINFSPRQQDKTSSQASSSGLERPRAVSTVQVQQRKYPLRLMHVIADHND
jgi:hypothetical protein